MGFCVCRLGHCQCWNDQNADFVVETLSESFMSSLVTMVGFGGRTGPPCRRRPDSKEPAKIPAEPPGATIISTFREVTPWQFAQLWKVPSLSPSLVTMKPQCPYTVPQDLPTMTPVMTPARQWPTHHCRGWEDSTFWQIEPKYTLGLITHHQPKGAMTPWASYDPIKSFIWSQTSHCCTISISDWLIVE